MDKKNMQKIIKKILLHTIGICCTVAVVFIAMWFIGYKFTAPAVNKSEKYYINDIYDQPIVQLAHEKSFEQPFEAHGDIYGVQIRWHNLAQVQNGTALIELISPDSENVLASTVYNLNNIVNDSYNQIAFDSPYLNDSEGYQPYILRITPHFDDPQQSYLKIWGDSSTQNIAFGILNYIVGSENVFSWHKLLRNVAVLAAVIVYAVCFIFPLKKENVFIVVLLAVSCLFTLVLPPFSSPDEEGHFNSAYRIVNRWDGLSVSEGIHKRAEDSSKIFEEKNTTVLNYEYIYENLNKQGDIDTETVLHPNPWIVSDFNGVYLFGALGIKLGHIFKLGYVPTMYLGRILNLLFFGLCIFFAIKITPVGKEVFMTLGLLPISLHLANSFSRDVFVISLAFLFTAYLLYLLKQESQYKWWQLALLAVICILLAPSKFIYVTLCIGILLLDISKIPVLNRIRWKIHPYILLAAAAAIILPILLYLYIQTDPMLIWKIKPMAPLEILLNVENDFSFSLGLLLENPIVTLKLFVNTIFSNGAYYLKSLSGGVLSYNSIAISDAFIFITLILVVISCFSCSNDTYTLKKRERISFVGIFALVFAIVIFMCITWTFVKMDTLYGLQGKYLLPALPMLLIALKGRAITVNRDLFRPICFAMAFTGIFVALNAYVVILQR